MKEKVQQYANDSAVAFTASQAAGADNGGHNTVPVILLSILAPVIRDLLINLISRFRLKKKPANEE